jgi:polyisoprenyl-phosphate glycosyltransferase
LNRHLKNKPLISIVISAYNESSNLNELYRQLIIEINRLNENCKFELIFVNDGSTDETLEVLKNLQMTDPSVKIVNFIRNFGHELAMTGGMDYSSGDAVLFMDADLQHPPKLITSIVNDWLNGRDIVLTKRIDNKDQKKWDQLKGIMFYKILNLFSDIYIPAQTPDFRLIDRKYVDIVKSMKENNRMFRGLISWIGCPNQSVIEFSAPQRYSGTTKYSFKSLLRLAIDSMVSFSIRPLRIASYIGMFAAFFAIILGGYFTYDFLTSGTYQFTGYGTTIVMVIFIGSVQLMVLGIIGEYLGRIHMEVKKRPLYIAEFLINESPSNNVKNID